MLLEKSVNTALQSFEYSIFQNRNLFFAQQITIIKILKYVNSLHEGRANRRTRIRGIPLPTPRVLGIAFHNIAYEIIITQKILYSIVMIHFRLN